MCVGRVFEVPCHSKIMGPPQNDCPWDSGYEAPLFSRRLTYLGEQGYKYIVRNSGGLAVVLDQAVLNLTLVLPETEKGIDINRGYEAMWLLIKQMFADFQALIEAREIHESYCPGSYDLSITGKKFAGISQRRLRSGVAVQIYLCVADSGANGPKSLNIFIPIPRKESRQNLLSLKSIRK